jgi:hypothetical protein
MVLFHIITKVGPIWLWIMLLRIFAQCRDRKKERALRLVSWVDFVIVTNGSRPERTTLRFGPLIEVKRRRKLLHH